MKLIRLYVLLALAGACSHLKEPASQVVQPPKILLTDSLLIGAEGLHMPASVRKLYNERQYSLVWFDSLHLTAAGDSLLSFIKGAAFSGLIAQDYHLDQIERLLRDSTDQSQIRADVLFTDAYFSARHHLKYGRLDSKTYQRKDLLEVIDTNGIATLLSRNSIWVNREFKALEPTHPQYHLLKDSLRHLLHRTFLDTNHLVFIETVKLNMERWRFAHYPSRYLQVNIPSFMMKVVEDDSIYLSSKVIVGKPENATPLLQSVITSFIIYPYWHVPRNIAVKELLPAIQYDSTYLAKHNYDVLDKHGKIVDPTTINWLMLHQDNFPYVLRQRDGKENALGIIKFLFNNPYNVYLHDTNSRKLFSKQKRALSHGCVRVHQAVDLAKYLTKDDSIYITPDDLEQYLSLQQRYQVKIVKPLPLFIQYYTCEEAAGRLHFYEDIYKKDSLMQASLHAVKMPILEEKTVIGL